MPARDGGNSNKGGRPKLPPLRDGSQRRRRSSPERSYRVRVELDCATGECNKVFDISPRQLADHDEPTFMPATETPDGAGDDGSSDGESFLRIVS